MELTRPTLIGTIECRYKRFFADILVDGRLLTAHVPNTGSMKTCWSPGWKALVSVHDNPKRKLPYTLEMVHNGTSWIGINTFRPNKMVVEAIEEGVIAELGDYSSIKTEHRVGNSRLDLLLTEGTPGKGACFVEVKNVTLRGDRGEALFPDAITTRGQKHLRELMKIAETDRTVMLFVVQREDIQFFSPADTIDPEYGRLLRKAEQSGVEILAYRCHLSEKRIVIKEPLAVHL